MKRPANRQNFPIRLPVGAQTIEPRVIKKAPNCTDKIISKQVSNKPVRISIKMSYFLHNGILGNWKPNGTMTHTRQIILFFKFLMRFVSDEIMQSPRFPRKTMKDEEAKINNR